jgi:hypothetical protein
MRLYSLSHGVEGGGILPLTEGAVCYEVGVSKGGWRVALLACLVTDGFEVRIRTERVGTALRIRSWLV